MQRPNPPSEFLHYLAALQADPISGEPPRLPSLNELSDELGVSVARLREQLEVARALGLVEVRPRTGIRRLPYTFLPAVRQSLAYAIEIDRAQFEAFSDLRNRLEAACWHEAVRTLTPEDHAGLRRLVATAWEKLTPPQVQIPHEEHRQLHLTIFHRLGNPFVLGILEAYWEAYEAVGLNQYAAYEYLQEVWRYHQKMVDSICAGDYDAGYQALVEHKDLLHHRSTALLMGQELPANRQEDPSIR
jgi:DNA-binding FadR family transcriptional regulator